jgi:hypothetical protein
MAAPDKDAATILEDAADLLLVRGRAKHQAYGNRGELCVLSAIAEAETAGTPRFFVCSHSEAWSALCDAVPEPVLWNDGTDDDSEVIDTIRHLAKSLRATAVPA